MIYHVAAMANNRVIGKNDKLPWHFSADLKFFKNLTMGHTIVMGRKTYLSIGKALPGRDNFILSRTTSSSNFKRNVILSKAKDPERDSSASGLRMTENVKFFNSIEDAIRAAKTEKIFIIGGAKVFEQTLNMIDGIYMTRIHENFEGDTFYPPVPSQFEVQSIEPLQQDPKIEVLFLKNMVKK